jgi:hypothetical protein
VVPARPVHRPEQAGQDADGGTLTQFGACQQVGGCTTTDNTPAEGWTQLYNLLNADPTVRHSPRWSADISYSS